MPAIRSLLFLILAVPLLHAEEAKPKKPNILLILADDLGFSDLGSYGGEIATPNLDKLASEGLRYSASYNSARCCPSRASLMTGLYPHQAGIGSFTTKKPEEGRGPGYTGHLLPNAGTMAELLGDAGYSTWMVGKWHLGEPGPIEKGFGNYYGYKSLFNHSEGQWNPNVYARLPENKKPELSYEPGKFYVTDVFTDYALEFLKQAREQKDKPWFLFLSHSSPHFPLHAPKEDIDKNMATYRKGWDVLRKERMERLKKLGLVPAETPLPPRGMVPVDEEAIANGYAGKENPAWHSLPEDRREDLARRMATFAAMVDHLDEGVGRILSDLDKHGETKNTLIVFLSDNGACYEWGPFGFDGESRRGTTTLHQGDQLDKFGQPGTHSSYGSAWANLGNTPLKLYKHFCHEGGISSPMIVHWPEGISRKNEWEHSPVHTMDILPTFLAAAGATAPKQRNGQELQPLEGISIIPTFSGKTLPERVLGFEHQEARGLRKGDWKIAWGKRMNSEPQWELYNLKDDRVEMKDLAAEKPELVNELAAEWTKWAQRVGVDLKGKNTGP